MTTNTNTKTAVVVFAAGTLSFVVGYGMCAAVNRPAEPEQNVVAIIPGDGNQMNYSYEHGVWTFRHRNGLDTYIEAGSEDNYSVTYHDGAWYVVDVEQ